MKRVCIIVSILFFATQIYGQCYEDRHSTNWFDGWISCEVSPNPNENYGASHWIMYDFGKTYDLVAWHLWNVNDPRNLDQGLKEVAIDYSQDGSTWSHAGVHTLEMATGESIYEGVTGPTLDGVVARYILITALENHGGACYGLSEVRFEAQDNAVTNVDEVETEASCLSIRAYPNPFRKNSQVVVHSQCTGQIDYQLVDVLGRNIHRGTLGATAGFHTLDLRDDQISPGHYYLHVRQGKNRLQYLLLKIE